MTLIINHMDKQPAQNYEPMTRPEWTVVYDRNEVIKTREGSTKFSPGVTVHDQIKRLLDEIDFVWSEERNDFLRLLEHMKANREYWLSLSQTEFEVLICRVEAGEISTVLDERGIRSAFQKMFSNRPTEP